MGDSHRLTKWTRYAAGSSASYSSQESPESTLIVTKPTSSTSMSSAETPDMACVSHGWISIMGRSRVMQDALVVKRGIGPGRYDFFGVYDGRTGSAKWCNRLHELVSEKMKERELKSEEWKEVMEGCFERIDYDVRGRGGGVEGSKAVVIVVREEEIVVASRGDSTAVLFCRDVAVGLSCHSHFKLDVPNEKRTLKPMVKITNRRDEDKFVVIASNGLWDVLSDEVTCQVVRRCLNGERLEEEREDTRESLGATRAAAILAGLAMARGSKDNISVVVVQLVNSV